MKSILVQGCVVVLFLPYLCVAQNGHHHDTYGTRLVRNKRSVRQRAFKRACYVHTCQNLKCNNEDGWYLYGSDWGCCGNYDGCCTWASTVCYYHDALCKCCDYGWLVCGPDCKKDFQCYESYEENTNEVFEEDTLQNNKTIREDYITSNNKPENHMKIKKKLPKHKNTILSNDTSREMNLKMKKLYKKKYVKPFSLNFKNKMEVSADDMFIADQPRTEDAEIGSGDGV